MTNQRPTTYLGPTDLDTIVQLRDLILLCERIQQVARAVADEAAQEVARTLGGLGASGSLSPMEAVELVRHCLAEIGSDLDGCRT